MPIATVKLESGIKAEFTPVLNAGAFQSSNLIRWRNGLPEKVGGWTAYYNTPISSIVRVLHAWEDLSSVTHLGIGATNSLSVLTNGSNLPVTPQLTTLNHAVNFSTTSGSAVVTIVDTGSNCGIYDVVVLNTPVSVGGLILQGAYSLTSVVSANSYQITATSNATGTVANGGAVPSFTTTSGSSAVSVTLASHGYSVGSTFAAVATTTVGGLVIQGLYQVTAVASSSVFTINAAVQASATATVAMNSGNAQIAYWITPAPGATATGYGASGYGVFGYGSGYVIPTHTGTGITATDWTLDNWGKYLVACPRGGAIYTWAPDSGLQAAQIISTAPTASQGIFVSMPQQILVAYGASVLGIQDPLLIKWSDVSDFTVWTAKSTNQAGSFRIPRGSMIVGAMQGPQAGLIWTDLSLWAMSYIGAPLVFGFNEIASGCGLIGQHAACVLGNAVFWMSQKGFFVYTAGGGVQPVPCDVWDVIFQNLNSANSYKIRAASNSQFDEVTWYFPSTSGTGENDTYVKFNPAYGWDYGSLDRTAWIDQSVLGSPIGVSSGSMIYQHETANDAAGTPINASVQTGYWAISDGWEKAFVDLIWPDMKYGKFGASQNASVQITFYATDYPGDTPTVYGPYSASVGTEFIPVRIRARLLSMQVSSSDLGTWWRLGGIRYRFAPDGRT